MEWSEIKGCISSHFIYRFESEVSGHFDNGTGRTTICFNKSVDKTKAATRSRRLTAGALHRHVLYILLLISLLIWPSRKTKEWGIGNWSTIPYSDQDVFHSHELNFGRELRSLCHSSVIRGEVVAVVTLTPMPCYPRRTNMVATGRRQKAPKKAQARCTRTHTHTQIDDVTSAIRSKLGYALILRHLSHHHRYYASRRNPCLIVQIWGRSYSSMFVRKLGHDNTVDMGPVKIGLVLWGLDVSCEHVAGFYDRHEMTRWQNGEGGGGAEVGGRWTAECWEQPPPSIAPFILLITGVKNYAKPNGVWTNGIAMVLSLWCTMHGMVCQPRLVWRDTAKSQRGGETRAYNQTNTHKGVLSIQKRWWMHVQTVGKWTYKTSR